jgi:hypothetical protein
MMSMGGGVGGVCSLMSWLGGILLVKEVHDHDGGTRKSEEARRVRLWGGREKMM